MTICSAGKEFIRTSLPSSSFKGRVTGVSVRPALAAEGFCCIAGTGARAELPGRPASPASAAGASQLTWVLEAARCGTLGPTTQVAVLYSSPTASFKGFRT